MLAGVGSASSGRAQSPAKEAQPPAAAIEHAPVDRQPSSAAIHAAPVEDAPANEAAVAGATAESSPLAVGQPGTEGARAGVVAAAIDPAQACIDSHEESQLARQEGRLMDAAQAAQACARESCPALLRADCFDWLVQVQKATPSILLAARSPRGDESSVRVTMDGRLLATELTGRGIAVDPGRHELRFELPGYPSRRVQVVVREGDKDRLLLVEFGPDARTGNPDLPTARPVPMAAYALGGLALIGAGTSVYLGQSMVDARDAARSDCAPFCSADVVQPIRNQGYLADTLIGVSVVSALLSVYFYATRPEIPQLPAARPVSAARAAAARPVDVQVWATAEQATFSVNGKF